VDFNLDLFYHTQISDPRCIAAAEVILVERDAARVAVGRFSVGWAALPLHSGRGGLTGHAGGGGEGGMGAVQVVAGSPRYLLYRWVR